jgi:hypothetical protein
MKQLFTFFSVAALSLGFFSSCSNNPTLSGSSTNGSNLIFQQIDMVGNAGTNEYFAPWANHDANNRSTPSTSTINEDVMTFITTTAGRSAGIANYAATNLLIPDVLLADFSQSGDASYLGVQSQGVINDICTGTRNGSGKFGGRGLLDDVVTTTMSIAYGNIVPVVSAANAAIGYPNVTATAVPDDGKEQNGTAGTPQLATDNVSCGGKHINLGQFPYLGPPI